MRITDEELRDMDSQSQSLWETVRRGTFAKTIAKDILEIARAHASVEGIAQRIEADIKERYGVE